VTALAHPHPTHGWQDGDRPMRRTAPDQWDDWPPGWPHRHDARWGVALPARHPAAPRRGDLARAGWDRGAYRRALAAELRAGIRELHAVDVRWVRDGGARLAGRWFRARIALDRLAAHALHEILAAADVDPDGLDEAEIVALAARPESDADARALGELLGAEALLARRREIELGPVTRRLERAAGLEPAAA